MAAVLLWCGGAWMALGITAVPENKTGQPRHHRIKHIHSILGFKNYRQQNSSIYCADSEFNTA